MEFCGHPCAVWLLPWASWCTAGHKGSEKPCRESCRARTPPFDLEPPWVPPAFASLPVSPLCLRGLRCCCSCLAHQSWVKLVTWGGIHLTSLWVPAHHWDSSLGPVAHASSRNQTDTPAVVSFWMEIKNVSVPVPPLPPRIGPIITKRGRMFWKQAVGELMLSGLEVLPSTPG